MDILHWPALLLVPVVLLIIIIIVVKNGGGGEKSPPREMYHVFLFTFPRSFSAEPYTGTIYCSRVGTSVRPSMAAEYSSAIPHTSASTIDNYIYNSS